MSRYPVYFAGFGTVVLFVASSMFSVAGPPHTDEPADNAPATSDVAALAAAIDEHIAARWKSEAVQPSPPADEAEYLRRTYLNLAGKIPRVADIREFLDDPSPNKKAELVDRLLESPAYVSNFTNFWRALMLPEANANYQIRFLVPSFEAWLREQLTRNDSYDHIARELVAASLSANPTQSPQVQFLGSGPIAFYRAKQFKPENIAAGTSRLFLGIRLECAQCHDHPFATWKREEFWSFAAFFSGISGETNGQFNDVVTRKEIAIPDTDKVVQAQFLGGATLPSSSGTRPRAALAEWLTSPENPYFARAATNRIWAHFFGLGLVDPVDDFSEYNSPSHPELLDLLAVQFAEHTFDVKFLIRAITSSKTYQLSSRQTHESQADPHMFARMTVKGLTAEQLFDSLATATGYFENIPLRSRFVVQNNSPRAKIRELFANENATPSESQTSILQALALMNGKFVADATSIENSATLAAVIDSPFFDTSGRVETLYLASLSREPRADELARLVEYVDSGGAKGSAKTALGDVFWALLNSSEFLRNH